jgi:hypothetical protein
MYQSYNVTLRRTDAPKFPDTCVICGTDRPGTVWKLKEAVSSWWNWVTPFSFDSHTVEVPACAACRRKQKIRRYALYSFLIIAGIGASILIVRWLAIGRGVRRLVVLGIVLAVAFLFGLIRVFFPAPPFDLTVHKRTVDYEFANAAYAEAFAALNGARVDNADEVANDEEDEPASGA